MKSFIGCVRFIWLYLIFFEGNIEDYKIIFNFINDFKMEIFQMLIINKIFGSL